MYIIFIDESGQPGGYEQENGCLVKNTSKFFILSGFMINAEEILNIEVDLKDIKIKYGLNPYHEIKWNTRYKELSEHDKFLARMSDVGADVGNRNSKPLSKEEILKIAKRYGIKEKNYDKD